MNFHTSSGCTVCSSGAAPTIDSRTSSSSCAVEKQISDDGTYREIQLRNFCEFGVYVRHVIYRSRYIDRVNINRGNPPEVWRFPQLAAKWIESTANFAYFEIAEFWIMFVKRDFLGDETSIFTTDRINSIGGFSSLWVDSTSASSAVVEFF